MSKDMDTTNTEGFLTKTIRIISWIFGVILGSVISFLVICLGGDRLRALATVIKSTSNGFCHKLVDAFFAASSCENLFDGASRLEIDGVWMGALMVLMCGLFGFIHDALKRLDSLLEIVPEDDKDSIATIQSEKRTIKRVKAGVLIFLPVIIVCLVLNVSQQTLLRDQRRAIIRVRPFISDSEYHHLNRQWTMIRSQDDYRAFHRKVSEYSRRTDEAEDGEAKQ